VKKLLFDLATSVWVIALFGLIYAVVLRVFLYRFLGMDKMMKEMTAKQKDMQKMNKEYLAAVKNGDTTKSSEFESQMNSMLTGMLKSQFKLLIFTLPLIFVYGFISSQLMVYFGEFLITLPFQVPIPQLNLSQLINWRDTFGPVGWFWITFLLSSVAAQVVQGGIRRVKESKGKKKKD
jgi:uncharacterized membrane protein (DUF106 family)